jgi:hypothetical protein
VLLSSIKGPGAASLRDGPLNSLAAIDWFWWFPEISVNKQEFPEISRAYRKSSANETSVTFQFSPQTQELSFFIIALEKAHESVDRFYCRQ